jgi:hypothetical protein
MGRRWAAQLKKVSWAAGKQRWAAENSWAESKRLGGLKQKKRKEEGEIDLKFLQRIQANEFKLKFEFNQTKNSAPT